MSMSIHHPGHHPTGTQTLMTPLKNKNHTMAVACGLHLSVHQRNKGVRSPGGFPSILRTPSWGAAASQQNHTKITPHACYSPQPSSLTHC